MTIKGFVDDNWSLGREFLNDRYLFEMSEHHELGLPEGVDKSLQRMRVGDRYSVNFSSNFCFKKNRFAENKKVGIRNMIASPKSSVGWSTDSVG